MGLVLKFAFQVADSVSGCNQLNIQLPFLAMQPRDLSLEFGDSLVKLLQLFSGLIVALRRVHAA